MTALLSESRPDNLWAAMPGWGIVADLTPPELVEMRRLALLRKQIVGGLVVAVLVCVAGYFWAGSKTSAADDQLAAANAQTQRLTSENAKYADVVSVQTATQGIKSSIATLMATDVDVALFVARVQALVPNGTDLTSLTVTLTGSSTASTSPLSTDPVIGTLTLAGTSQHMIDVAAYVAELQSLRGVTAVVPSSNAVTGAGTHASWTLTAQLTDKLYSHRFTAPPAPSAATPTSGGH